MTWGGGGSFCGQAGLHLGFPASALKEHTQCNMVPAVRSESAEVDFLQHHPPFYIFLTSCPSERTLSAERRFQAKKS